MERYILHVDVNNAFLSWTAVDMLKRGENIDIREIPAVIGGDEERRSGIVLAKSPIAKKFGIVTGEPIYFAKKKCASIEIFPCDFKLFNYYSDELYKILLEYTDKIERFSIDECFLDMTEYLCGKDIFSIAKEINKRVKEELGFTVNIGVANNKLLAKMASDFTKPDKVHTLFDEEIKNKMWNLPIEDLFMLGKSSASKLREMNIKTIGELARMDVNELIRKFKSHGKLMWEFANGIDNSEVYYLEKDAKSISSSTVLPYNYNERNQCLKILKSLSSEAGRKLRDKGMYAKNVSIWIKYSNFIKVSKQISLNNRIHIDEDIYKYSILLFDKLWDKESYIRGLCVGVSDFSSIHDKQLSLFDENNFNRNTNEKKDEENSKLQKAIDEIRVKYGNDKIMYADMIKNNKT